MNVALIIPTGIGCEIGGHAGDGSPAAKLIASCCDKLITHPNVFNASDINEMPENCLYVDGSTLDRFLRGEIYLNEVFYNKILLAVNEIDANTQNAVNAARVTIGADIEIVKLDHPLIMKGYYDISESDNELVRGKATGEVKGWLKLCEQVEEYDFDALAIQSFIDVDQKTKTKYLETGGVNPWGGIEAITSKLIADKLDKIVAHAPYLNNEQLIMDSEKYENFVSDPRMSAEMISTCYIHCVFKGLHKAPKINYKKGLNVDDIDFLITPIDCVGDPHYACMKAGIPIIAVKENSNILNDKMPDNFIVVNNYMEAAGLLMAFKAGVSKRFLKI